MRSPASTACCINSWYAGWSGVLGFSSSLSWISNPCANCAASTSSCTCSAGVTTRAGKYSLEGCSGLDSTSDFGSEEAELSPSRSSGFLAKVGNSERSVGGADGGLLLGILRVTLGASAAVAI